MDRFIEDCDMQVFEECPYCHAPYNSEFDGEPYFEPEVVFMVEKCTCESCGEKWERCIGYFECAWDVVPWNSTNTKPRNRGPDSFSKKLKGWYNGIRHR